MILLATGEPKVSLVTSRRPPHLIAPSSAIPHAPARVTASAAAPIEWVLLFLALAALGFATWQWSS